MRALNLVWSAVWWNEGLYIAGNPFKGPRAHLDLAVAAHGLRGLVCVLPWLVWPSPCRWAEAEGRCTTVTMRHFPSQPQGAHLLCEHSLMASAASVLCFCRQVSGIVITPMTGIKKSCCIINKHNRSHSYEKVIKVIDTPFTEQTMPTCHATKTPLGGTVETPSSKSQTEQILFSHFLTLSSQFQSHSLLISSPHSPVSESAVQAGWQDGWVPTAPGFD